VSNTEDLEQAGSRGEHTPIIDGDWKLNVHTMGKHFGYRRYHKHDDKWHCVTALRNHENGEGHCYVCGLCGEEVPEDMEGYVNLARWSSNAD
jgi:hypothetical protein